MNQLYDYEKPLTSGEAAKMLNINTRTLNSFVRKGVLKYHVYDKRKFFSYDQISAFMIEMLNVPIVRYREDLQA